MPNTTTYTDVIGDWEKLLAAVNEHEDVLPDIRDERAALQQALQDAKDEKARQESYKAARQLATQELEMLLDRGREIAMRLRGAAKLKIGPRSELLVQFGVAPLRRRTRRNPEEIPPAPPPVETPAPEEGAEKGGEA